MRALILVDIQHDFLPGRALPVPEGDAVVAVANRLLPHFPLVVATQDWHPANHGSFAVNHPGRQVGEVVELDGLPQLLWPAHCVQGSAGAAFAAGLQTDGITQVFTKGVDPRVDSYSGFYDNDHRQSTGLGEYLHAHGVTEVYLLGLATDYCVKFTALDARRLGFATYLVADGCRGVEVQPGDVGRAFDELRMHGVVMVQSDEVVAQATV